MLLALIVHAGCSLTVSRRTVVGGSIASLGLARRPLPALAAEEPEAVQRLLALVDGRRAQQWQPEERAQMDRLIEEVMALQAPWNREDLRGRWKLAYLQPGPGGGGVDRHASMIKLLPSSPQPLRPLTAPEAAAASSCLVKATDRAGLSTHPGAFPSPSYRGTTASRCSARTA